MSTSGPRRTADRMPDFPASVGRGRTNRDQPGLDAGHRDPWTGDRANSGQGRKVGGDEAGPVRAARRIGLIGDAPRRLARPRRSGRCGAPRERGQLRRRRRLRPCRRVGPFVARGPGHPRAPLVPIRPATPDARREIRHPGPQCPPWPRSRHARLGLGPTDRRDRAAERGPRDGALPALPRRRACPAGRRAGDFAIPRAECAGQECSHIRAGGPGFVLTLAFACAAFVDIMPFAGAAFVDIFRSCEQDLWTQTPSRHSREGCILGPLSSEFCAARLDSRLRGNDEKETIKADWYQPSLDTKVPKPRLSAVIRARAGRPLSTPDRHG